MKPVCVFDGAGSLTKIQLTNISGQDKIDAEKLFDDFANSRVGVAGSQIARDLIHAIDNGYISIGSLETLSRHCHTGGTWTPCIDPASAISKWLTGGMVIPRLLDENVQPVEEHQALCQQIISFVRK